MNQQICNYLDKYNVPRGLDGYELLVRVIGLTLKDKESLSIRTHMDQVAEDIGATHSKVRTRIRYVLLASDAADTKYGSVNRFVRNAVMDLRYANEDSGK